MAQIRCSTHGVHLLVVRLFCLLGEVEGDTSDRGVGISLSAFRGLCLRCIAGIIQVGLLDTDRLILGEVQER
jgi:hypothetical protein